MTDPRDWPADAVSLLDTLWAAETHHLVIKRRMAAALGFMPDYQDIRAVATRHREITPLVFEQLTPPAPRWNGFGDVRRPPDNPLRKVPPGTHAVPKGGYRLGMNFGRTRP